MASCTSLGCCASIIAPVMRGAGAGVGAGSAASWAAVGDAGGGVVAQPFNARAIALPIATAIRASRRFSELMGEFITAPPVGYCSALQARDRAAGTPCR